MLGKTEGKRRKARQRMRWLDSITDSMGMDLGKFQEIVKIPCCSGSQTWLSNWKHTYCKYILKIWATIQVSKLDKLVSLYVTGFLWIIVSLGNETEEAMANHYSTLAWKIPWMEEPGRLQSMGLLRLGHNRVTSLSLFMHWRRKWQPTPVFLSGEPQGQKTLVGCHLWGRTDSDMNEAT